MKSLPLIAIISATLLTGCTGAEEHLEIKGKVLDNYTKAAIPNREIIVQALRDPDNKVVDAYNMNFSTDSSGSFTYPLKRFRDVYLYNFCIVGDSTYAYSNIRLGLTELDRYGKFLNFTLNKLTDLDIIIHSKGRTFADDILFVSWKSDEIGGKFLYPYKIKNYGITSPNKGLKWTGKDIRSKIKTRVFANKQTVIRWELFSEGTHKVMTDSIMCSRDMPNYFYLKY
jgi:hypothetical protein